ncbi:hypothetical protein [Streptomyces sp. F001]|uniref:hypothetical protein n=1 Tax=Streptomyces sp. F001 TaxID=1510026 RepID=UPI0013EE4B9B|nr:hypothetical protein [Streptomyces sp. F001]
MPSRARITAFLSLALSAVTLSAGLYVASAETQSQTSSQVNVAASVSTNDTGWG